MWITTVELGDIICGALILFVIAICTVKILVDHIKEKKEEDDKRRDKQGN